MNEKRAVLILFAVLVAACAGGPPPEPAKPDVSPGIAVTWAMVEYPRIPHPGYRQVGVMVTKMTGETVWTEAGILVGDVIETVNGEATLDPDSFWEEVGRHRPARVRIRETRSGMYGGRLVAIEVTRS